MSYFARRTSGVGPDDYTRWKNNFGESLGSDSTAPGSAGGLTAPIAEPATTYLLALGLLITPILRGSRGPLPNNCQRKRQICCYLDRAQLQSES